MGVLVGAFIGANIIFASVFWVFDAMAILVLIWTFYNKDILIGFLIGWLISRKIDSINTKHNKIKNNKDQTVNHINKILLLPFWFANQRE